MKLRNATALFSFFFNDTATTEIYTLSLHDALPIALVQVLPLTDVEHVLDQAGVGERDALRGRSGPRGVEDVRDVGRLHRLLEGVDLSVGDSRSQLREVAERGQAMVALRGQAHEVPEQGEGRDAGTDL